MTTYVYWVRGKDHAEYCDLSIRSVRKVDRHARVLVYTDDALDWKPDALLCRHASGRPAMMAREEAKVLAITSLEPGEEVLFLDSDILLQQKFPFDNDGDLYLTWREYTNVKKGEKVGQEVAALMPFNGGVIGARVCPATIEAFIWLKQRMLKMAARHHEWWGDQLAMMDLVGTSPPGVYDRVIRWTLDDRGTKLRVRVLDGEVWNYTPMSEDEDFTGKGIIHCKGKGSRKAIMRRIAA